MCPQPRPEGVYHGKRGVTIGGAWRRPPGHKRGVRTNVRVWLPPVFPCAEKIPGRAAVARAIMRIAQLHNNTIKRTARGGPALLLGCCAATVSTGTAASGLAHRRTPAPAGSRQCVRPVGAQSRRAARTVPMPPVVRTGHGRDLGIAPDFSRPRVGAIVDAN